MFKRKALILTYRLAFFLAWTIAPNTAVADEQPKGVDTSREVTSVLLNGTLSNVDKVKALTSLLDRVISSEARRPLEDQANFGYDYAAIIAAISRIDSRMPDARERQQVISQVIKELFVKPNLHNNTRVLDYLYIALGLAGGTPPDDVMERMLNGRNPRHIVLAAVRALKEQQSPIFAVPFLLMLAYDPWNYVDAGSCVGPQNPQKIYPIRDAAYEVLMNLGIRAEKTTTPDAISDPDWHQRLSTTTIKVDKASLLSKLREWLLSDDPTIWQAADKASFWIPGEDLQDMIGEIVRMPNLPAEKKQKFERWH